MDEPALLESNGETDLVVEEAFAEYLGHWNRLISTTNWEKGRIISLWRRRLVESGAPVQAYSDEAWARRVGNVSGQHVGRLRRVFEQFGEVYTQYTGLFWSHFQAVLDWSDAEMWLEGAVQNAWSVSQMRSQRWEALGGPPDQQPRDDEIVSAELDEDSPQESPSMDGTPSRTIEGESKQVEEPDFGDESTAFPLGDPSDAPFEDAAPAEAGPTAPAVPPVRPFEGLPEHLPADLAEALEGIKLAILNHKLSGWKDVACADVLAILEGLKQLVLAPQ